MKFNHRRMAEQFTSIILRAGGQVDECWAGTGTRYITAYGHPDDEDAFSIKVRFSDHGECYCSEDMSVDPDGCTLHQAVRAAARETNLNLTTSLAAFKAAATRRANEDKERDAKATARVAARKKQERARVAFQEEFIVANYPDYQARSTKSRKRIRAKANKLFEAQNA